MTSNCSSLRLPSVRRNFMRRFFFLPFSYKTYIFVYINDLAINVVVFSLLLLACTLLSAIQTACLHSYSNSLIRNVCNFSYRVSTWIPITLRLCLYSRSTLTAWDVFAVVGVITQLPAFSAPNSTTMFKKSARQRPTSFTISRLIRKK